MVRSRQFVALVVGALGFEDVRWEAVRVIGAGVGPRADDVVLLRMYVVLRADLLHRQSLWRVTVEEFLEVSLGTGGACYVSERDVHPNVKVGEGEYPEIVLVDEPFDGIVATLFLFNAAVIRVPTVLVVFTCSLSYCNCDEALNEE